MIFGLFKKKDRAPTCSPRPRSLAAAALAVSAYVQVLQGHESGPTIRPLAQLPCSKDMIRAALKMATAGELDREGIDTFGACYLFLADFQSPEDASVAARAHLMMQAGPSAILGTQDESDLLAQMAEALARRQQEMEVLRKDWETFLEQNGLASPVKET